MGYRHDVFLSYRRANAWPRFVEKHFLPMFRHWLTAELGHPPEIFFDANCIETGMQWPDELADGVASSRVMVCLWSREYFSSDWCQAELSHMLARREAHADPTPPPLVLAAVLHDGDRFPAELSGIQRFPIQKYSNPWLGKGSKLQQELSEKLIVLAEHVATALPQVPEHDSAWHGMATDRFDELFRSRATQTTPPSLGGPRP